MKPRTLKKALLKAIKTFPAIVVTGPRQSGKTTLLKMLFKKTHNFVTLEDPDIRLRAQEDPRAFLENYQAPIIFDEIQYVPELLPYIKTKIDENRKAGQWLFTGSQNFSLMNNISESLAGRIAVFNLLPFSFSEYLGLGNSTLSIELLLNQIKINHASTPLKLDVADLILRGNYPEIVSNQSIDRQIWCSSYIATYIERDVRSILQVSNFTQFERFVKTIAVRTGSILNISMIAKDLGISTQTIKRWLSVLETAHIVYLLYPYYKNIGKRLIKSPKIYFCDTALASYLLGINNKETLINNPCFGNLFETYIISDFYKRFLHFGNKPTMYYLRTRDGLEIDLVIENNQKLHLFEIKSGMTITTKHAQPLFHLKNDLEDQIETAMVLSNTSENCLLKKEINSYNWMHILGL